MSSEYEYIDGDGDMLTLDHGHVTAVHRTGGAAATVTLPESSEERVTMARVILAGTGYAVVDHDPLGLATDPPPDLQDDTDDEPSDKKPSAADRLADLEMSSGVHGRAALALFRRTDALAHRLSDLETTVNRKDRVSTNE